MGSNWTEAIIKSLIEQQKENNSYQLRITLLRTLSVFIINSNTIIEH
jgi:hypothetical protein